MDTDADTCCAGVNWKLLDSTNEVCEVSPFLDSYKLVKEVMVTRCGTVWTSPDKDANIYWLAIRCYGLAIR
jgi:hypothetical protein